MRAVSVRFVVLIFKISVSGVSDEFRYCVNFAYISIKKL